ncbi:MAG TPA: TRAM domain-containing protein, partial [Bacillota bacterium]|nr:TRAM domain-containing protein [Bacillota bacterium]
QNNPVRTGQVLEVRVEEPHGLNTNDGIARYNGLVINIDGGGELVGERVTLEVYKIQRTSARARILKVGR